MVQHVDISIIATDKHTGVASLMNTILNINMICGTWLKMFLKLGKKAKMRHCGQLLPWIQSISNHLWWSAQICDGYAQLLVYKLKSIVHHQSNVHVGQYIVSQNL